MLVRAFVAAEQHHRIAEYSGERRPPAGSEICIHGWPDTTLREIASIIQLKHEPARRKTCKLSMALVYPDRTGRFIMKDVGSVHATRESADDAKTLAQLKVQAGDYFDVAVVAGL